jgi:hypothetical protein
MIFYRIGCYILIATCLIHLSGRLNPLVPKNETEKQLFDLMENQVLNKGSATFTMGNIQNGMSFCFSLMLLWTGVMSLYLSYALANNRKVLRNVSLINTISLAIAMAISVTYFFWAPTSCLALGLAFSALGTVTLVRKAS